jgi:hypothetical protein
MPRRNRHKHPPRRPELLEGQKPTKRRKRNRGYQRVFRRHLSDRIARDRRLDEAA